MRWQKHIFDMKTALLELEAAEVPVAEMPDAAGAVRDLERRLAELRHRWNEAQVEEAHDPESELGPPTLEHTAFGTQKVQVVGRQYRTVTTRSAKRTYNTAAILHDMVEHGLFAGSMDALGFALRERLARVEWRWSDLTRYARTVGLPLRTVAHAIPDDGDLDAPHVGEEWRESIKQEAVESKEEA